jgi:hypothetical protein
MSKLRMEQHIEMIPEDQFTQEIPRTELITNYSPNYQKFHLALVNRLIRYRPKSSNKGPAQEILEEVETAGTIAGSKSSLITQEGLRLGGGHPSQIPEGHNPLPLNAPEIDPAIKRWIEDWGNQERPYLYKIQLADCFDPLRTLGYDILPPGQNPDWLYWVFSSWIAQFTNFSKTVLKGPGVIFREEPLITALRDSDGEITGTPRGDIREIQQGVERDRRLVVVLDSPDELQREVVDFRETVRNASLDQIPAILKAANIVDNRSPEQIQAFYKTTGTKLSYDSIFEDLTLIGHRFVKRGARVSNPKLQGLSLDNFREHMRNHPREWDDFRRQTYYPNWAESTFGTDYNRSCFVVAHDELPKGTIRHFNGAEADRWDLISAVKKEVVRINEEERNSVPLNILKGLGIDPYQKAA